MLNSIRKDPNSIDLNLGLKGLIVHEQHNTGQTLDVQCIIIINDVII